VGQSVDIFDVTPESASLTIGNPEAFATATFPSQRTKHVIHLTDCLSVTITGAKMVDVAADGRFIEIHGEGSGR
jgi:hypothetical protein